eukprot:TRINITY_DN275_c0_g1_i2.p1 TRINITY_DN275_c0_g1~~TRINITY_DN275_c0_g1_i2.p1  ORF type:complete len:471 (+),score=100.36 TRINITY_DN275_c0_g1_i2:175-1587(+)
MMELPDVDVETVQIQPQTDHTDINGTQLEGLQDSIDVPQQNGVDHTNNDNQLNQTNQAEVSEQQDAPSELPKKESKLPDPARTDSQVIKESAELAKKLAEEEEAADRVRRLRDLFGKMGEVKKTKKIAPRQDKIPDVRKYRPADDGKPKAEKKKFRFDVSKHGYVPKITKNQARAAARMASHGYMPGYIGTHRTYANMDHGYVPYMSSVTASDAKLDHGFIQFNNQPKTVSVHWDHGFMPNSISREKFGQNADHGYLPTVPKSGSVSNSMDQMGRQGSGQDTESVSGMNEDDLAMFASVQMLRDRFSYEPSESQSYSYNASTVGPEYYNEDDDGVTQVVSGAEEGMYDSKVDTDRNEEGMYDSGIDTDENGLRSKGGNDEHSLGQQADQTGDDVILAGQEGQESGEMNGSNVSESGFVGGDQDKVGLGSAKQGEEFDNQDTAKQGEEFDNQDTAKQGEEFGVQLRYHQAR